MKIAAILTVFNRKQKTLDCLQHLFEAVEAYNKIDTRKGNVEMTVFMTDDGCTDGTAEAVRAAFPQQDIHIVQGTGSLFWAGGMRLAWQTAIDSGTQWDYYLLLNDDTNVFTNVFQELLAADEYGYQQTGRHGLSSGICCEPGNPDEITYGGRNFVNQTKGRQVLVRPTGHPQPIDMTHANILLTHHSVVERIGIFHQGFRHSGADQDYGMMAHRHDLPVFSTAHVCGECECDHHSDKEEARQLMQLSLADRKRYVNSPLHSDHDYLLLIKRNLPMRYPVSLILRTIRVYCPSFYYSITSMRGVYKAK